MTVRQESLLISAIVKAGTARYAVSEGVNPEMFATYGDEYAWLMRQAHIPSKAVFAAKWPKFRFRFVRSSDLPTIVEGLKDDYLKTTLARVIEESAGKIGKLRGEELALEIRLRVSKILETTGTGAVVEIIEEGQSFVESFRERQKLMEQGQMFGVSTGFPSIDAATGGLLPANLYVVIARQGQAKSYMMLRWAAEALLSGKRVLWFSREMPEDMIAYRIHTIMSSILKGPDHAYSNLALILGREDVNYADYRKFVNRLKKTVQGKLFIPKNRRLSIQHMQQYAERHEPDIIFYDYIGIIGAQDGGRSWAQLGAEANEAKGVAMNMNVPVVLASQVNRSAADAPNEAPMVENISYSDAIGYAADRVFSLTLSRVDPDDMHSPRYLEVWIRKARYGENDQMVTVEFRGDTGTMREIDSPRDLINDVDLDDTDEELEAIEEDEEAADAVASGPRTARRTSGSNATKSRRLAGRNRVGAKQNAKARPKKVFKKKSKTTASTGADET